MTNPTATLSLVRRTLLAARSKATDRQLLARFTADGDQEAFAALVRRHTGLVLGVCRRALPTAQDAEDASQATFLILMRKAAGPWQESVANWLFTTARRVARDARRSAERRVRRERRAAMPEAVSPIDQITGRELLVIVDEELDRLPPRYREPLMLFYLEELARDEIAERLNVPVGTVKIRLERGRKRLGDALTKRGVAVGAGPMALAATSAAGASSPQLVQAVLASGPPSAAVAALVEGVAVNGVIKKSVLTALAVAAVVVLGMGMGAATNTAAKPAPEPPKPAAKANPAPDTRNEITVDGQVLDSAGAPVAGAKIRLLPNGSKPAAEAPVRATADRDGRFHFTAAVGEPKGATLIATADGRGPDWTTLDEPQAKERTLKLPAATVPVRGRLIDLQGQPVVGAKVKISIEKQEDAGGLSWVEGRRQGWLIFPSSLTPAAIGGPAEILTDKDGRFEIPRLGDERVLALQFSGRGLERNKVWVMVQPKLPDGLRGGAYGTYPAEFQHLLGPGRDIVGTVRDQETGKPIAGVTIFQFMRTQLSAVTDEAGRYRIEGAGMYDKYGISASWKLPYFPASHFDVEPPVGLAPLTVDFELQKGFVVRGKVTEKGSGKPVRGSVNYQPNPNNPNLGKFPDLTKSQHAARGYGDIADDGTFEVLAIPGPGALCVMAGETERYGRTPVPPDVNLGNLIAEQYHTIVGVNVSPDDPKSMTCDVQLQPGRSVRIQVAGPDDKPLAGYRMAGATSVPGSAMALFFDPKPAKESEFTVAGLSGPRKVLVVHSDKRLARLLTLHGNETGSVTARLEPLGSASGKVTDALGKAVSGVVVKAQFERNMDLPFEMMIGESWPKTLAVQATTDARGAFRLDGLVPGLKYTLTGHDPDNPTETLFVREGVVAESQKTTSVGILQPAKK